MENWYTSKFRRHLADMHIADWDEFFLSEFDEDEYVNNLKIAQIDTAMIYMQSHIGLCYFPTKVSKEHKAFQKDNRIKKLMEKCRKENISIVGYYSLIFNNQAYYDHPNWRMINERGRTVIEEGGRGGLICPNNSEYREFLINQMNEFFEYFPKMDGVFYDMPFWPVRCMCKSCQKRFWNETGYEIPREEDWTNPIWLIYIKKRQEWMAEFSAFVTNSSKEIMPDVSVSQNFAGVIAFPWWAGSTEGISKACDYVGGDLYGDLYDHSFSCKYYLGVTKNSPFEYMLGSCEYNLAEHTVLKTESKLQTEVALTAAHHGATMIIDAIDLNGKLHKKRYERFGKIFETEREYEPYLYGDYIADVAVYYDSKSQFSRLGYSFTNKLCANRLIRTFIKSKISAAVIANDNFKDLTQYKMIFAPCLEAVENEDILKFIKYVKEGGILYLSSASEPRLIKEFFEAEIIGMTEENRVYLRPTEESQGCLEGFDEDSPMSINYAIPLIKAKKETEILAKLTIPYTLPSDSKRFASFHSNPPGIKSDKPVILKTKYGKGWVIWSAAAIEVDERPTYCKTILNILYNNVEKESLFLEADCSESIEIVSFKDKNNYLISFVDLEVEERQECRRYSVGIKTDKKPKTVKLLPEGKVISYTYKKERTWIKGEFAKFQMIKIEL